MKREGVMTRAVPKKPRDGNIELLRCLLMFAVVLDHSAVFGPLIGSWQGEFLFLATGPAVSGFVAISGWFGIKFSWNKWLRLLALAIVFRGGGMAFRCGTLSFGAGAEYPIRRIWDGLVRWRLSGIDAFCATP